MVPAFSGSPVRLGIITDIQFADKADCPLEDIHCEKSEKNSSKLSPMRLYSQVLRKTESAVATLNATKVSATVQLGDIVDGNDTKEATKVELEAVIRTLKPLQSPLLHVLGNHCLSTGRSHLVDALRLKQTYYIHDISDKWRLIVLDSVDISIDHDDEKKRRLAQEYLEKHVGSANALPHNGGLSLEQLAWLESTIEDTRQKGMWSIICAHIPIYLSADHGPMPSPLSMWDANTVATNLARNSDVVKAYFCGHFHPGSYVFRDNIHYVTFKAMLDSQSKDGAWAIAELYDDGILIDGRGDERSFHLRVM